ncbi:hypothetical protein RJ640_021070 [Escallonia rubra]|uniref:Protein kinase domain-containing protein n=1 Tax=Escallonia rubra TaxID=112253 RepID=A0AA88RJH4_9ASTE|nr:hypothetical protein RJ640_021070 [Escallonia rubra]
MSLNMKTLTQALAKTAAVIEKTVHTTVQDVTGPKPLQDYDLFDQIGSAGPALAWKLYSAKARGGSAALSHQYPTVCVWVLDKRALSEARQRAGLSKAAEDSFFDVIRADAARLVRLRHPGVVHVVQALDESKNAMAMVTEPLFASVANALGNVDNIAKVPKELQGMEMSLLEVKHGLLQIAESLDFLHNNARLIHRAVSPETVLITANGAWKLGGFSFAISADQPSHDLSNVPEFHFAEYDTEDSLLPLQPSLNYTAPELVRSRASSVGYSSDVFSFGCLAYHLIARKPLFECHNNVKMVFFHILISDKYCNRPFDKDEGAAATEGEKEEMEFEYMNTLTYLSSEAFSSIPSELVPDLQKMLSTNEAFRPSAIDFTGSPFFRDDTRLRALRFLDHMLERDNMQKSEFLKALSDMWKDFDSRVLRYKVLPPLCAELRNMVMQPMILPMVLTIAESQDKSDFEQSTLPALVPVLSTAAGETLLLLLKHAELIINKDPHETMVSGTEQELLTKASQDHLVAHILPMLVRAYDDTDARMQEEVLKKTLSLAKQLDVQLVKQAILPRVHGLALKTTVAAVRVNALLCLGDMVHILDKQAVLGILQTIQRCTAVDHSAPTLMCTLGVANSMLKQHGVEFAAEHVLPLLMPLLIAQQLNVQQFAKYMLFVKDVLRKVEEKRGVTVTDTGTSEVKPSFVGDGHRSEPVKKSTTTAPSSTRSSPAWDEDWIPTRASATTLQSSKTNVSSLQPAKANQPIQVSTANLESLIISAASSEQTSSCPAVDVEWPPRSSAGVTPQSGDKEKQYQDGGAPSASFDDVDPFADWPPRASGSLTASGSSGHGTVAPTGKKYVSNYNASIPNGLNSQVNSNSTWAFNTPNSVEPTSRQNQGNSTLNSSSPNIGLNGQNSIGFMKSNAWGGASQKTSDLGLIFGPSTSEQTAPRLAPPPSTAVGRGRGRGRGNQGRSQPSRAKSSSEQPPLLDLL